MILLESWFYVTSKIFSCIHDLCACIVDWHWITHSIELLFIISGAEEWNENNMIKHLFETQNKYETRN